MNNIQQLYKECQALQLLNEKMEMNYKKVTSKKWSEAVKLIKENSKITRSELFDKLGINPSAII